MTQEEKLQKEIARIVSCEEELNYFENKGDLINFVAHHFYEIGKNTDETIRKELIFFLKEEIPQCSIKEHADKLKEFVSYLEKQKDTMEKQKGKMTVEEFQLKLKEAKENKYVRAQLLWELMHNGIITEVDYQYLTDDKRKPWTIEEYRIAYQKGFEMSEQLKQKEKKPTNEQFPPLEGLDAIKAEYYDRGFKNGFDEGVESVKPVWSEEDEIHRNFILESLEDQIRFCKKNAEGAYYAKQIRTAQNWLKSLSPSWKSSDQDELMRLKYADTSTKLD